MKLTFSHSKNGRTSPNPSALANHHRMQVFFSNVMWLESSAEKYNKLTPPRTGTTYRSHCGKRSCRNCLFSGLGGLALVSLVGFGYSGFGSLFLQICPHSSIQFKNNCMLLDKVTLNDFLKCVYRWQLTWDKRKMLEKRSETWFTRQDWSC